MGVRLIAVLLLCSYSATCQSIDELTKALSQGGDSVEVLYQRAQLYTQKGDYNSALADLDLIHTPEQELQLKIENFKILLLSQLGRAEEAKQGCLNYLARDPDNLGIRITLGEIMMSQNDPYGALAQFSAVTEKHPDQRIGYIMRALILTQLGKTDAAKRDLATVESDDLEMFAEVELAQMATVYNMHGDHEKALKYADAALERNQNAQAYALRGWALFGLKYYREAIVPLNKSIELQPSFLAYVYRAKSYYMMNDFVKAESDFKTALRAQPDIEEAYVLLGHIYKSRSNFKDACDCWRKALELSKENDVAEDFKTYCK